MSRNLVTATIVLILLLAHDAILREDAAPALPLVKADYQACTTVKPGPIERPDGYKISFRRDKDVA